MDLTKTQKKFLKSLQALNTRGVSPNVLQVASATKSGLSHGQTLYLYKVCNQLVSMRLIHDHRSGWRHKLAITEEGLQALEEER